MHSRVTDHRLLFETTRCSRKGYDVRDWERAVAWPGLDDFVRVT